MGTPGVADLPRSGHTFHPSILREYDVRGIYGKTLFEADAYALGRCFATVVQRAEALCARELPFHPVPRIVVGRDGRLSSPQLEEALVTGLREGGVDVVRIGLGPSPMAYFAEASLEEIEGAVQVTGSHNPADHNGFKIVFRGRPFFGPELVRLGEMARRADWTGGAGQVEVHDVVPAYVRALREGLFSIGPGNADADALSQLNVGWDAGNGAAGPIVERLCAELPGRHHVLHSLVDGRFPNHHPDPTLPENLADLRALVAAKNLDFGVAFDGDGDRLGVVDGAGKILWSDEVLTLFARDILRNSRPGGSVVGDVKMSSSVFSTISEEGGHAIMAKSGHSHIKSAMKEAGAVLGGEMSGHLFFADSYYGFDDGIYAAVRLMALVARSGKSLVELGAALPRTFTTPELRLEVPPERRLAAIEEVAERVRAAGREVVTLDGLRVSGPDGWWLLRASNTQDMLTARAEGSSEEGLARLVAEMDAQLALSGLVRPEP